MRFFKEAPIVFGIVGGSVAAFVMLLYGIGWLVDPWFRAPAGDYAIIILCLAVLALWFVVFMVLALQAVERWIRKDA